LEEVTDPQRLTFRSRRRLRRSKGAILVEEPPAGAEWEAVRDRLRRAAET
jgi:hypothetical protein